MAEVKEYATIRLRKSTRNSARVTKAKLGLTWTEFLDRAATELDPQPEGDN